MAVDDPTLLPMSHQAVADKLSLDMKHPHTRAFIAALYWRQCAVYWRHQAKRKQSMYGFEYGVYMPGDLALVDGESEWRKITGYTSEMVFFDDGSYARSTDIVSVKLTAPR